MAFAYPEIKMDVWDVGLPRWLDGFLRAGLCLSQDGLYTRGFLLFSALLTLPLPCSGEQSSGW